jgi:hypothetical protein
MKLNLNMPARAELKVEATEVLQAVEEDRRFVYQATIVRLMKGRKVCYNFGLKWAALMIDSQTSSFDPGSYCSDLCKLPGSLATGQADVHRPNSRQKSQRSRKRSITSLIRSTLNEARNLMILSKLPLFCLTIADK